MPAGRGEDHRDEQRDFRKLRPEEQKEYWTWRHSHGDHDRTTTTTTTKIAIDTGLIGNRQAVACPHFLPWMACNGLLGGLTFGVNSGKSSGYDAVENSPVKPDRARLRSIRHAGDRRPAGRRPA